MHKLFFEIFALIYICIHDITIKLWGIKIKYDELNIVQIDESLFIDSITI